MFPLSSPAACAIVLGCVLTAPDARSDRLPAAPRSTAPLHLAQGVSAQVWCHDTALDLVRRVSPSNCEGKVVSDAEAARIKDRRVQRIKRVLKREKSPVVPGRRLGGTGTGFFISPAGHLLTNNHVVEKCAALTVTRPEGDPLVARLIHRDARHDLALLGVDQRIERPARFRPVEHVTIGESVTVVGYPLHGRVVIRPILVTGTVKESDELRHPQVFAMKIDVRRGNSGGPILDQAGRVMGVVFAKVDTPKVYSKSGKLVRDVALGMRIPVVRHFLRNQVARIRTEERDEPLQQNERLRRTRDFVAQIGCWK